MQPGDILVFNGQKPSTFLGTRLKGTLFEAGERWFTNYWIPGQSPNRYVSGDATHVAIVLDKVRGKLCYFGAELTADLHPIDDFINDRDIDYLCFSPKNIGQAAIDYALDWIWNEYRNQLYSFGSIPFYIARDFGERCLHKDCRRWRNPVTKLPICSKIGYHYTLKLFETGATAAQQHEAEEIWNQWRMESFHATDMIVLLSLLPQFFALTEGRWSAKIPKELGLVAPPGVELKLR